MTPNRRLSERQPAAHSCKVFQRGTRRYLPALTRDVSSGGALLEVHTSRAITLGEKLGVGVAWSKAPVVLEDALMESKVVRIGAMLGGRQCVAVAFIEASEAHTAA